MKDSKDQLNLFVKKTSEDINAYQRYQNIEIQYEKLISTQN
jgi:hypothetical protein